MFETNFSEHGTKKIWEQIPHRVCGPGQNRRQKIFHWVLYVCAGGLDILKIYFKFTTWTAFADCAN